jgi:hypothetical protein
MSTDPPSAVMIPRVMPRSFFIEVAKGGRGAALSSYNIA